MTGGASEQEQRQGIADALTGAELTHEELWLRYFGLGGTAGLMELEAYVHDLMPLPAGERDMLAHAVNERLTELAGPGPAPYSRPLREAPPADGPLPALVGLLKGARLAPPEDLPVLAAAAGRTLDTQIVVYLVDYAQRELTPLPHPDLPGEGQRLDVDSSLAGRAFRRTEVVASSADGTPRLWVPLLDGAERLGVLEVALGDVADLYDLMLREQLTWVGAQLGHLLTALSGYGDSLHAPRLSRVRTPAAELIWSLLPPLAAGTAGFSVAGLVEPSSEVGGDAFDYALAATSVSLAILDGMGHGLAAGLMASAALVASRAVRRDGGSVDEQARAIDDALAEQYPDALVTGVLAELDLTTGQLRYVAAGHPHPLLLRRGQVVKALEGGRRTPFGVDGRQFSVGEEHLERGDVLMLYTDGVTEARDADGGLFGEQRLIDFLEREAASGHPPSESVRRLMHAVLSHQDGILRDDATVLLARWDATNGHRLEREAATSPIEAAAVREQGR
ncbi:MAG TPA: PP2C family protein-serine/threonine phosphatase [Nocardioidaceae bacterium]|nr:PP2C family protein-serine/threonine phosphatase [Nocardioidaceae bacterium]